MRFLRQLCQTGLTLALAISIYAPSVLAQSIEDESSSAYAKPTVFPPGAAERLGRTTQLSKFLAMTAADTLANRGFEDDAVLLDPWVVADSGGGSWFVQSGTLAPLGFATVESPTEGLQAAMADQSGPGTHILYQDVELLDGPASIELRFDLYADNDTGEWIVPSTGSLTYTDTANQHIRVDIMDPNAAIDDVGAGVLLNIFRPAPGLTATKFAYSEMTTDLSAFVGATVRLRFAEVDNQGNLWTGVDDVRLIQTPILPATPSLLTPLNGAIDIPLEGVELRFTSVPNATRYNVQVATDMAFNSIIWTSNVPSSPVDFVPPDPGVTYYWRAQSEGVHGKSAFSAPFHFTTVMPVPNTPTLLTPLNGASEVPNMVDLRFTTEEWATRYNVQVATDAAFTALVLSGNVPHSPVKFSAPAPGVKYFWRAQSVGEFGNSLFSAPFAFTTEHLRPEVVTLVAPAYGATDQESPVRLQWKAAAYAERYEVQVSRDSLFSEITYEINTPGLETDFVAPFAGETYFWRIQGFGPGGASPGYSDVWRFSVAAQGSLIPMALSPEDGATDIPVDPLLTWQAPASSAGDPAILAKTLAVAYYRVEVATTGDFADLVVDEDSVMADSLRVMGLMHETEYHWRVAGVSSDGGFTFSPPIRFTTVIAAPAAVTLVAPADAATGQSARPEFSWEAIDGATAYQFQISKENAFATPLVDEDALTGNMFQPATPLDYSTVYYWRVRAMNDGGWGEWSAVRSLTTAVGTAIEHDAIPATYALYENYPNPFNPSTTITVDMPETAEIRLSVYDVLGHEVIHVASGRYTAGQHRFKVDASNLSSGMYLYRMESASFTQTRRMMLLK